MEITVLIYLLIAIVVIVLGCLIISRLPQIITRRVANHIAKDAGELGAGIVELDDIIANLRNRIADMLPSAGYRELQAKLPVIQKELAAVQQNCAALETELASTKGFIANKEKLHNEIKKGRADNIKMADELIANKEALLNEMSVLQDQLADSKAQLDSLNEEVELTEAQKSALDEIKASLKATVTQLNELSVVYGQISKSFVTLEGQYQELEKEYRRLIEVELSRNNS